MGRLISAFLVLFLLTACAPAVHKTKTNDNLEAFPVDFLDENAEALLKLIDHRSERLPSGHVNVMLKCVNDNPKIKRIWMDWKVVFFDARNADVEHSVWHTEYLAQNEIKTLQVSSIRRDIQSYRFLIRSVAK